MDGNLAPGSGVTNYQNWNATILQADAADINCADVHWYPINGTPAESVQSIMELVDNIPPAAAEVKSALAAYDPSAYFVVGETNMSQTANAWNEQPVGALFAAANAMEWLSFGAQSVDWWDVHNYGTSTADFGMLSSATGGEPAVDTPEPPYYGYELASKLAVKGAKVGTLAVATPNIYGYYSRLPGGSYSVMLVNADPSSGYSVSTASLGLTSSAETEYSYSAASPTVTSSSFTGSSVAVPAESVVVLTNGSGAAPSPSRRPARAARAPASRRARPRPRPPQPAPPGRPRPRPRPPGPGRDGRCQASWSVVNSWTGGFQLSVHRDQLRCGAHHRLERQLLLARLAGHHPDLERRRHPVRGRGQRDERQLRRRAASRRDGHVRPARQRHRPGSPGYGAMHREELARGALPGPGDA